MASVVIYDKEMQGYINGTDKEQFQIKLNESYKTLHRDGRLEPKYGIIAKGNILENIKAKW